MKKILAICILFLMGCSQVQMSPDYAAALRQAAIMAEVRNVDCQAGDPNECRENSQHCTETLKLLVDALDGKGLANE